MFRHVATYYAFKIEHYTFGSAQNVLWKNLIMPIFGLLNGVFTLIFILKYCSILIAS